MNKERSTQDELLREIKDQTDQIEKEMRKFQALESNLNVALKDIKRLHKQREWSIEEEELVRHRELILKNSRMVNTVLSLFFFVLVLFLAFLYWRSMKFSSLFLL